MKSLQSSLSTRLQSLKESPKRTSERGELLKQFLDRLNPPRVGVKDKNGKPLKPLTPARLGMLLRFMDKQQLYAFYAELKQAKNFSKSFWWRVQGKDIK